MALASVTGAVFAWGALVACGSGRPPPADTNRDSGSAGTDYDGGSFSPSGPSVACVDDASTPLPDQSWGVSVTFDGAPTECSCAQPNRNGTQVVLPCGFRFCLQGADRMWDCASDAGMRVYQGGGVGTTCDAATIPPGAPPCDAPR